MKIAVYLGSTSGRAGDLARAEEVGAWLGRHGHTLVYGGSDRGMMGALADGVHQAGGSCIGVIPSFMVERGWQQKDLDQMIVTPDMPSRRAKMIELADGFIALPGGIGTLDEISEVMAYRKLGLADGEIVLFSWNGFYEPLRKQLEVMADEGFYPEEYLNQLHFIEKVKELDDIFRTE
jgi:uncharacterized protein (TIGR00730 family)